LWRDQGNRKGEKTLGYEVGELEEVKYSKLSAGSRVGWVDDFGW